MKINILLYLSIVLFLFGCKAKTTTPKVIAVYPTSDSLPENLLRMYIQFSSAMKTVDNLEKIKLIDSKGNTVENVFFNNAYELWNDEQNQLTLILDPSRVKTGLQAHNELGRALRTGENYRLYIEGLEDVEHRAMAGSYIKEFHVSLADTLPPMLEEWELLLPNSGTNDALIVQFPTPLDQLSLKQRLVVTNEQKELIDGNISLGEHEMEWNFIPSLNWKPGSYFLYVNARLEDPSGNNLNGLFDHKMGSLNYDKEGELLSIPFQLMN